MADHTPQGSVVSSPSVPRIPAQPRLPRDFDVLGYVKNNPQLRAFSPAALVQHYLEHGAALGLAYRRYLDTAFYARLYLPEGRYPDAALQKHFTNAQHGNYANLGEMLSDNGFTSSEWVRAFPFKDYVSVNTLGFLVANEMQALRHFVETGLRTLLPVSRILRFDPAFYAAFTGETRDVSPEGLYRHWVQSGLLDGVPPNEAAFLHAAGIPLDAVPTDFDADVALAAHPELAEDPPSRWELFRRFVTHDAANGGPLPLPDAEAVTILLAAGNRHAMQGNDEQAGLAYERGLLRDTDNPRLLQAVGDVALRQGHGSRALYFYARAQAGGAAGYWVWMNAANAARQMGDTAEATRLLLDALRRFPRDRRLSDALVDALTRQGDREGEALRTRLRRRPQGEPDLAIAGTIEAAFSALCAARVQGAPRVLDRPAGAPLRVVGLANTDLPQCTFYRVLQKVEQISDLGPGQGVDFRWFSQDRVAAFKDAVAVADIAIFYRVIASTAVLDCLACCRAAGVPAVYEIDDLVFDPTAYPEDLASFGGRIDATEHLWLRYGVPMFRQALALCDFALASTDHLAAGMAQLLPPDRIAVHRNGLSRQLEALARAGTARSTRPERIVVFYGSGTRAHMADFSLLVEPALLEAMEADPPLHVLLCGFVDAARLQERHPQRVEQVDFTTDREAYLGLLRRADLNLSVLAPGTFNDCKSEIKWLEAAALGIPTIASRVGGFTERLRDGHDIVLAGSPAEWRAALHHLTTDGQARAAIAEAARAQALAQYGADVLGRSLGLSLGRMHAGTVRTDGARKRILVVNVFFPPQTIGGATRVVRDQVDSLLDQHGQEFEVAVLCGNADPGEEHRLSRYFYRSCPVFQIDTPLREFMDWTPEDPEVLEPFTRVLEFFRPDLVHFHCIQRLGAGIVEATAARNIPFLVSVHDAWWISDHQFLTDELHRLRYPWDTEVYETEANPHTRTSSDRRRLRLASCLARAAGVLAVSDTFAGIYRRAGIGWTVPVPNGIPVLAGVQRVPSATGRLRLGHVGGASTHKGYDLLRNTITAGGFEAFEVTVVDHEMDAGDQRAEMWGSTPVMVMGPVSQDEIAGLYARLDILVAPSLWPESFGLVTREAMACGLWVIASSLGAIGEDVRDGINGFVVDVRDPQHLARILHDIQARREVFHRPPPAMDQPRRVSDQVREVVDTYRRILQG